MRKHVPRSENVATVAVGAALVAVVGWVMGTRDDFDATERDLPVELLYVEREPIEIYNRPLAPWVEPGTVQVGASAFDFGEFPPAVADDAWQPTARVRRFGPDNLYAKINGEAEKFIKQGFVSLHYLVLREAATGAELAIELFDQGDVGGSLGVFAEHAGGREVRSVDGVTYFTTSAGVIGRAGSRFFRAAADQASASVTRKAAALVRVFGQESQAGEGERGDRGGQEPAAPVAQPDGFAFLQGPLGLDEARIQYQESNVFAYDFASGFWFGDLGLDGKARLFVHFAKDDQAAAALVEAITQEQVFEYEPVPVDEDWSLFRHKFQATYFVLGRRGRHVYGAEKLPEPADADRVTRRIERALADG